MSAKMKNILLTVLAAVMLVGFALAIPSGTLTQEARQRYLDGVAVSDEFAFEDEFTFEDDDELILFEE